MVTHTCPICQRSHQVREIRAALAYGRQLTCSPDCESERRKRMRMRPAGETANRHGGRTLRSSDASYELHTWVVATVRADLLRTAAMAHEVRRRSR